MTDTPLSVLLLADDRRGHAETVREHIAAFGRHSRHRVFVYNPYELGRTPHLDLADFDVAVIHYTLYVLGDKYLPPDLYAKLKTYRGLKVQFIQDEYRQVDAITYRMRDLGIHVVFTSVPAGQIPKVYGAERLPGVDFILTLTGYVPENWKSVPMSPPQHRPIDIGYRGRPLPYWLGRLAQEKTWIAQGVHERAPRHGLRCDIGWREEDRIYGKAWYRFLASCKGVLGTESGATITDFDGSIERSVRRYLELHPDADYEEVAKAVLEPHEGKVAIKTISPRVFEAIVFRNVLIQFPGEYSGILRPWDHYFPLARDFSNLGELARFLHDPAEVRRMTERAHADIVAPGTYSYAAFVRSFDEVLSNRSRAVAHGPGRSFVLARSHARWARLKSLPQRAVRAIASWKAADTLATRALEAIDRNLGTRECAARPVHRPALLALLAFGLRMIHAGLRVCARPPLRRVALDRLRRPRVSGRSSLVELLEDLVLVDILRDHLQGVPVSSGCRVDVDFDARSRVLRFTSRKDGERSTPPLPGHFGDRLESGDLPNQLIWDHSLVATELRSELFPGVPVVYPLGQSGIHAFKLLCRPPGDPSNSVRTALKWLLASRPSGSIRSC